MKKSVSLICALLAVFFVLCSSDVMAESWPLPRGDTSNSACSNVKGPSNGDVIWEREAADRIEITPVVDSLGNVYVAAGDYFYGFDPYGGEHFSVKVTDEIEGSELLSLIISEAHESAYIGLSINGNAAVAVYSLDFGTLRWVSKFGGTGVSSLTADEEGVMYFGTDSEGSVGEFVYAVRNTGSYFEVIWESEIALGVTDGITYPYCPAVGKENVFFLAEEEIVRSNDSYYKYHISAVDKKTGDALWKTSRDNVCGEIVVSENGEDLYYTAQEYFFVRSGDTGKVLESKKLNENDKNYYSPLTFAGNTGYALRDNRLYALDVKNAVEILWEYSNNISDSRYSGPISDSEGTVFFVNNFDMVYAINNQKLEWKYDIEDYITTTPALGPNGTIYFGTYRGILFAINDKIPPVINLKIPDSVDYVHGHVPVNLSASSPKDYEIEEVSIHIEGQSFSAVNDEGRNYFFEWDVSGKENGTVHSIVYNAKDRIGGEVEGTASFTIDSEPPETGINVSEVMMEYNIGDGDTALISGSSRDDMSGVKHVTITAKNLSDDSEKVIGRVDNIEGDNPFNWSMNWDEAESGDYEILFYSEDNSFSTERFWDLTSDSLTGNVSIAKASYEGESVTYRWKEEAVDNIDNGGTNKNRRSGNVISRPVNDKPKELDDDESDSGEAEYEISFRDIYGHWAADSINYLTMAGVISGYPDGLFRPEKEISRMEFIKFAVDILEIENNEDYNTIERFSDYDDIPMWGRPFLAAAVNNGIMQGYHDNTIRSQQSLNENELGIVLARLIDLQEKESDINYFYGTSGKTLEAAYNHVTRAKAADILLNFLNE